MKLLDIGSSPDHPLQSIFVDSLLGDGRAAGVIRRLKLSMQKTIFGETVQVSVTGWGEFLVVRQEHVYEIMTL